ncbi:CaiB/BaiF CoA-transferase family protein [Sphingosinicella sp.]|uniref:CaiB/BaiF CoA transferase family protein n=1 Tax=Sphingosinicella sp. TaxID=1917971 RepID=UPI0025F22107|nr:CaiB/BaiF CoA-transferase family protein [Sphingosinicella sp.]
MATESDKNAAGPLSGIRIVEFAGLGPTPFAAMLLADYGADVLRIDRKGHAALSPGDGRQDFLNRSRASIALDIKSADGFALARQLIGKADVLLEGYRPGVMERLQLGPNEASALNSRLIYARMTGWGQSGPLAHKAGHDINYVALTGGLHMMGSADAPPPVPLNVVGDFGGGGMLVVSGILAALVERQSSGRGQIVDAAMIDGAALLLTQLYAWKAMGFWSPERAANLLDGGAYFYRCYETADGYVAVGAIEPQFHAALITGLGLNLEDFANHMNRALWRERARTLEALFKTRTRDEWITILEPFDACVTPVLTQDEAVRHPANASRSVFTGVNRAQPNPAPRFSRTPAQIRSAPTLPGEGGYAALKAWGIPEVEINALVARKSLSAE